MKKLIALAASAIAAALVFTGCSSGELGFYNTYKAMTSLKNYNYSGSMTLKINKFAENKPAPGIYMAAEDELTLYKSMLNNTVISYDGNVDSTNSKVSLNLKVSSGDSAFSGSYHFICDGSGNDVLLDVSPEIGSLIPSNIRYTQVTINGTDYYQYDTAKAIQQIDTAVPSKPNMQNPYDANTQKTQYDAYTAGFNAGYNDGYYSMGYSSDYSGDVNAYTDGFEQGHDNIGTDMELENFKSAFQSLESIVKQTPEQQDLQSKIVSLEDDLINNYFSNLSLGLVNKTGDSTYSCETKIPDIYSALKKVIVYIENNPENFKAALSNFAGGLTDSQVKKLGISGAATKAGLLDDINSMSFADIDAGLKSMDEIANNLSENTDSKINYSLRKTGSSSYCVSDSLSINNNNVTDAPYSFDFAVSQNITIDGGSGNSIGSDVSTESLSLSTPTLSLNVSDPNVVETGILVSANQDMSSPVKLKAAKQGASYSVDLSSLKKSSKYYYEIYTVDKNGNLLINKQIKEITVPAVNSQSVSLDIVPNPPTGDSQNVPIVLCSLGLSAAAISVLAIRKKYKKV